MKKSFYIGGFILLAVIIGSFFTIRQEHTKDVNTKNIQGKVLAVGNNSITLQDDENIIYTFSVTDMDFSVGERVILEYTGLINAMKEIQDTKVISYTRVTDDNSGIPTAWQDNGIFSKFYTLAYNKLQELSLNEKIGQLILARYPSDKSIEAVNNSKVSGFVFFEKDFKEKTVEEVIKMIEEVEKEATIPLLTSVDEEGGKVVRISSNNKLVPEKFKSSQELYNSGGMDLIKEDTKKKSEVLSRLGLNVNLAPVVDVSDDKNAYIYDRTIGQNSTITANYASAVIEASKGTGVSYTLKHFPGYGNNADTHIASSIDNRSYDEIMNNDIIPFQKGIENGAESVLVSHNVVTSIDKANPSSLSIPIHNLLRANLSFTGVIITDDIDMGATKDIDEKYKKAILAGNDLLIVTDYEAAIQEINKALKDNTISEELINKLAFKVLAWKYYKGLMAENEK